MVLLMITIIAGTRDIWDYNLVDQAVYESGFNITEVVSGYARGVDTVGEAWSLVNGLGYAKAFKADWDQYGLSAGHRRNLEMAIYAQALIAIWDGKSKGTRDMIKVATQKNLVVYVKNLSRRENYGLFVVI
jgi:hypothetical protein